MQEQLSPGSKVKGKAQVLLVSLGLGLPEDKTQGLRDPLFKHLLNPYSLQRIVMNFKGWWRPFTALKEQKWRVISYKAVSCLQGGYKLKKGGRELGEGCLVLIERHSQLDWKLLFFCDLCHGCSLTK